MGEISSVVPVKSHK